jgi:phosphate-selective porin OprO and OprP
MKSRITISAFAIPSLFALTMFALTGDVRTFGAEDEPVVTLDTVTGVTDAAFESFETRLSVVESQLEVDPVKPTIGITGRIHADYWGFPSSSSLVNEIGSGDPNGSPKDFIGFRRLRIGFKGDITTNMFYKMEFDVGEADKLALKDNYIGWKNRPFFQKVVLGIQKRPYGLDHLNSSRLNVFMERPYVVEAFNQDARRIGITSNGVSENESWNWQYGLYSGYDISKSGNLRSDNYMWEVAGRLARTLWYEETSDGLNYAHVGISGTCAFPDEGSTSRFVTRPEARTKNKWFDTGVIPGADTYQLLGLEGALNMGSLSIVGELQTVRVQRAPASDLCFGGGYVYVAYWLTGESTSWKRSSGTINRTTPNNNFFLMRDGDGAGAWQAAVRFSHGDFSDDDIYGGVGDSVTLGLNWWWNPHAHMQLNYINGQIDERVIGGIAATSGHYNIFGTRFMIDF